MMRRCWMRCWRIARRRHGCGGGSRQPPRCWWMTLCRTCAPGCCGGATYRRPAGEWGLPDSFLQDAQQHDGQLEEGGEGDADDDGAVRIGAGRDEAGEHPEAEEDVHALLTQETAAENPHHAHEGDDQRQLEDDAERQQKEGDEAEVTASVQQQDEILAAEA